MGRGPSGARSNLVTAVRFEAGELCAAIIMLRNSHVLPTKRASLENEWEPVLEQKGWGRNQCDGSGNVR